LNERDAKKYLFGPYLIDLLAEALYLKKKRLALGRKSYEVLRYFVLHPLEVVPRDVLLQAVWRDTNVTPGNVEKQVSNLRKALRPADNGLEYIETVHGDGYRFTVVPTPRPTKEPLVRILTVAAAGLAVLAGVALTYWHFRSDSDPSATNSSKVRPAFYAGLKKLESGEVFEAKQPLEREVLAEPSYGPARAALSASLFALGYEVRARDEAEKAWHLLSGLSREETLWVEAEHSESMFDWQRACRTYETLHGFAPEQAEWAFRYSLALAKVGKQKEAYAVIAQLRSTEKNGVLEVRMDAVEAAVAESDNDYQREYAVAQRVEKTARSKGLPYQIGHAQLSQVWALDNLSKLAEAESKALDAKSRLAGIQDEGGVGQAWKLLGDVYIDQGRLEMARSAYQEAETAFRQIGCLSGEAVALNNHAYVLRDLGDLQGARDLFGQSLKISRSINDLERQALALNGVAIVLKRIGNLGGAAMAYSDAIEIAKRLSDDGKRATHLNNLAIVFQDQGRLPEARSKLNEALRLFQKLGRQADVAMVFGNLGDVEIRAGNLAAAENHYKDQLDLGHTIPSPHQLGYGLLGLGEVYFARCDVKKARAYLGESLQVRERLHEAGTSAETSLALAEVDLQEEKFGDARRRARSAADEFAKERQADQEMVAEAILGEALAGEGRLPEALSAGDSVTKQLSASENKDSQIDAKLHLSKIQEAAGRDDDAWRILQSVVVDSTNCGYSLHLLEAKLFLARLKLRTAGVGAELEIASIRNEAQARGFLLIAKKATLAAQPRVIARVH
jgi:DNA-binding winged helix-turn-helix (wHTH) protein/Flp pilus assembly protein TadD